MPTVVELDLELACINIPKKVGDDDWETCFRKAARHGEIFGINENETVEQAVLYRKLATELGYDYFGTHTPNPIFWKKNKYELIFSRVIELHGEAEGWRARRWPGFNAARYATVAILRDRKTGAEITVINTHWVPRGRKVNARWREWARTKSLVEIGSLVKRQREAGRVVVLMGDFNIAEEVRIWGIQWLRKTGVDKIGIGVPKGGTVSRMTSRLFEAPTDHEHGVRASARAKYTLAA